MNENLTELIVVLDRSGSMSSVRDDAIGGFNTFLKAQQEAVGEAKITVVQFDTVLEFYATDADVKNVAPLTTNSFVPRGTTALYDAVGLAIDNTGKKLAKMDEKDRPGKVLFAILTDGKENASSKYSGTQIKSMIAHQRDVYKWDFLFLAAGEGAFMEAEAIGMHLNKTMKFTNTGANQTKSFDMLATYAVNSRSLSREAYASYSSAVDLQAAFDGTADLDTTATADPKIKESKESKKTKDAVSSV
jgi:uncharacterized protein YegL